MSLERPPAKVPMFARSKAHADFLSKAWGCEVNWIWNGVDLDHYRFESKKENYILFLGRMSEYKGSIVFAEMCERLGIEGIICGEDSEQRGIPIETVKQILKIANRYPKLHYLGRVSETKKVELLSKAKALVSPLMEPFFAVFDLVICEALGSGTPVIVTDRGAPAELLGGVGCTDCGYVAKDVEDLQNALEKFADGEIKISSKKCRDRAKLFSVERMINKYLECYERMIRWA